MGTALLISLLAAAGYFAFRRPRRGAKPPRNVEPTFFGGETTDFVSQLDRGPDEDAAALPPHRGERPPAAAWSARVFEDIEWQRFEAVCDALFAEIEADAGVVQSRHGLDKPVDLADMREFHGLMTMHPPRRGTFVTSGAFTPEALGFARDHGIHAVDGLRLLALISRRPGHRQKELLAIAYEGEYWRPTCASCGLKMVENTARGNRPFWGCANFPSCRFTLPVRAAA
jgi:restriction system protein